MSNNHLANIIGSRLGALEGLRVVLLPDSPAKVDNAVAIAQAANVSHKAIDEQPFAILVAIPQSPQRTDKEDPFQEEIQKLIYRKITDSGVELITIQESVQFRLKNRLFIYLDGATALHSMDSSTTKVLDSNFPLGAKLPISIQGIAEDIAKLVISKVDDSAVESKYNHASKIIECCLLTLVEAHKSASHESNVDWNSHWWEHVNLGIDNLLLIADSRGKSGLTYSEFFDKYTYASFGLPQPNSGNLLRNKIRGIGRDIDVALTTWWSDSQTCLSSVNHINERPEVVATGKKHPISEFQWSEYDQLRAKLDSTVLAFSSLVQSQVANIEAFAEFTEDQFFYPPTSKITMSPIRIFDETGEHSRLFPNSGSGSKLNFIQAAERSTLGSTEIYSENLVLRIPVSGPVNEQVLKGSQIKVKSTFKGLTWQGNLELGEQELVLRGKFKLKLEPNPVKSFCKEYKLFLDYPENDPLAPELQHVSGCSLLLFPDYGPWVLIGEKKTDSKISKIVYRGPETAETEPQTYVYVSDDGTRDHVLLVSGANCFIFKEKLTPLEGYSLLYSQVVKIDSDIDLRVEESDFVLRSKEQNNEIESPLIAAIDRQKLTSISSSSSNRSSIRGQLENLLAKSLESDVHKKGVLHYALPIDNHVSFEPSEYTLEAGLLVPNTELQNWKHTVDFSLQPDFLNGAETQAFINSFLELDVIGNLRKRNLIGDNADWPSRTSWRHLYSSKKDELEAYLYSFEAMVAAARSTGNAGNLFWATYPFSASIWDTERDGACKGLLISPLHPIRLAWLASVEETLWNSEKSRDLVGTIEGWNFPALGPSFTKQGAFLAVPSDTGDGQIFSGWAYLLPASIDGAESLTPPTRIAGLSAPGSAAGGMNKSSVTSALKDYRRVNPHVTTITVDLAASTEVSRLQELDEALIRLATDWGENQSASIPGGIRIYDSLNRLGESPIPRIQTVLNKVVDFPLVWSHYKHRIGKSQKCNIRFLQDSGLRIEVRPKGHEEVGSANLGVLGPIPLRRFEAYSGKLGDSNGSFSFPTMIQSQEASFFYQALRTVENANSRPSIQSQLFKALLVDENADWTVSGESMISPGSIAALLQAGDSQKMLWEWRPPFFERGGKAELEQRPFISIARIPNSFRQQVKDLLTKASGSNANDMEVESVLKQLGSRGVGLSSLITMGGTHAAGALGFYLTLSLVDMLNDDQANHFVMPLDACDSFLRSLAGAENNPSTHSRADLLLISISDRELILTPIEIKSFGLGSENPNSKLPGAADSLIGKAKSQIQVTMRLLEAVIREGDRRQAENYSSHIIWINALSALVEAAIKLSSGSVTNASALRDKLQSLASGQLQLRIGNPLVTYYGYKAYGENENTYCVETVEDKDFDWGLFAMNTSAALEMSHKPDEGNDVRQSWRDLVNWAVATNVAPEKAASGQQAEPDGHHIREEQTGSIPESPTTAGETSESGQSADYPEEKSLEPKTPQLPENTLDSPGKSNTYKCMTWPESSGVRVQVGSKLDGMGSSVVDYWPGNTALTQMNFGVVGNLGTGKTQFLLSVIAQLRESAKKTQENPLSFLIFDYKSDYQRDEFLREVNGEVLRPDFGIPLNVLSIRGEYSKIAAVKKAEAFCDVIAKIYANVGPVQKTSLVDAIVQLFEDTPSHTAPPLSKVLEKYKQLTKKNADAVISVLNKFVRRETFIEDPAKIKPFEDLINDKVLVISLSDFGADNDSKNTLVVLFLDLYYDYMKNSTKWPFEGEDPQIRKLNSFLLVDEATNIMQYEFQILKNLLLEGREYGFGIILASQYLSHFKTSSIDYAEALKTWMIHQVPSVTAKQLRELGISDASDSQAKKISDFKLHEGFYSSLGHKGTEIMGLPFYKLLE